MDNKIFICERCGKCLSKHANDVENRGWLCDDGHYYASPAVRPLLYIDRTPYDFQGPLTKHGSFYHKHDYE